MDSLSLNEERELNKIEFKRKKQIWGDPPEQVTLSSTRELSQEALIHSAFREGIKSLDSLVNQGKPVSMREYGKLFKWVSTELKKLWHDEIQQTKKEGWEIESRTWCGQNFNTFVIPSLGLR